MNDINKLLRQLPKIDLAVNDLDLKEIGNIPAAIYKSAVRETIESFRQGILSGSVTSMPKDKEAWKVIFMKAIQKRILLICKEC